MEGCFKITFAAMLHDITIVTKSSGWMLCFCACIFTQKRDIS